MQTINIPAMADEPIVVIRAREANLPWVLRQLATRIESDVRAGRRPVSDVNQVDEFREAAKLAETWRRRNAGAWLEAGADASEPASVQAVSDPTVPGPAPHVLNKLVLFTSVELTPEEVAKFKALWDEVIIKAPPEPITVMRDSLPSFPRPAMLHLLGDLKLSQATRACLRGMYLALCSTDRPSRARPGQGDVPHTPHPAGSAAPAGVAPAERTVDDQAADDLLEAFLAALPHHVPLKRRLARWRSAIVDAWRSIWL